MLQAILSFPARARVQSGFIEILADDNVKKREEKRKRKKLKGTSFVPFDKNINDLRQDYVVVNLLFSKRDFFDQYIRTFLFVLTRFSFFSFSLARATRQEKKIAREETSQFSCSFTQPVAVTSLTHSIVGINF